MGWSHCRSRCEVVGFLALETRIQSVSSRRERSPRPGAGRYRFSLGRRSLMACIYVHEDADKAGHNGHDTSNTKRGLFVSALSVVSCFVRVFMSVALCPSGLQRLSPRYRTKLYLYLAASPVAMRWRAR